MVWNIIKRQKQSADSRAPSYQPFIVIWLVWPLACGGREQNEPQDNTGVTFGGKMRHRALALLLTATIGGGFMDSAPWRPALQLQQCRTWMWS